jgi:dinuclear metal center YbgI/SA1388 family protein
MTLLRDIINVLETAAPPVLQESYDNSGWICGEPAWPLSGVLVCLDLTPQVALEAKERGCNLIVSHHPLIFRGLKRIDPAKPVGEALVCCIKNDIAVYAIHTNLDNVAKGVNGKIAALLGLQGTLVLQPIPGRLRKLVVFVPHDYLDPVRKAIWLAGAGHIGQYDQCSYSGGGTGTFRAGEGADPFVGEQGRLHEEPETRLEVILPDVAAGRVVAAMQAAHPYEEVAYDLYPLENTHPGLGSGMIGTLASPEPEGEFLERVRKVFRVPVIRHTAFSGRSVSRVAVCGGAGSFLVSRALVEGADAFLTADLKYHEYFEPAGRMLLADIGHYESEQFTPDLLIDLLKEKFPTFAVLKTGLDTNPIHYFYS